MSERVARLEPERLVEAIRRETGEALAFEGVCGTGEVGAAYVRRADGRAAVLTARRAPRAQLAGSLAVVDALRAGGYPAPAVLAVVELPETTCWLQERLPGRAPRCFTHALLDAALALNERQAGVLAGRDDVPAGALYLRKSGPGFCQHEPLRAHGGRAAALERRVAALDAEPGGRDAVHFDFHPGNLLTDGDRITGVVDFNGAGRGDRRLDLVTLRFGVHGQAEAEPGVAGRLDALLDAMPAEVLAPLWAHMSLRLVDWALRHHGPERAEHWLDLAERRI